MQSEKKNNIHYALVHALFWFAYCTGTGYMSSCLLSIGYTDAQVGMVIAACGIGSVASQSVLSGVIDRSGKRLLKPVMTAVVVLAVLLSGVEFLFPENMPVVGLCYGCNVVALQLLVPLINSMSVCSTAKINFGFGRAVGSMMFAFAAFFIGKMVTGYGVNVLPVIRICAFLGFVFCVMRFPIQYSETVPKRCGKEEGFFRRNPGFGTIMVGCTLVYFCQTLLNNNGYQIIVSKGGDNTAHGIALAIAALIEVPVMLLFQRLLKYRSAAFWFAVSGFGYAAKAVAFLAAPNVPLYFAAQAAQLLGWPLMQVASVRYVASITAPQDTTRGQSYITATYSIALIAGSPLGGFLLQYLGVPSMLVMAALCSVVGGAIMTIGIRKRGMRQFGSHSMPSRKKAVFST